jgi:hypothetical protein
MENGFCHAEHHPPPAVVHQACCLLQLQLSALLQVGCLACQTGVAGCLKLSHAAPAEQGLGALIGPWAVCAAAKPASSLTAS